MVHCKDQNPVEWLKQNWNNVISSVQTLATQLGREAPLNVIGTLSEVEARDALRLHKGNVWAAVRECVEQRQKKVYIIKRSKQQFKFTYIFFFVVH